MGFNEDDDLSDNETQTEIIKPKVQQPVVEEDQPYILKLAENYDVKNKCVEESMSLTGCCLHSICLTGSTNTLAKNKKNITYFFSPAARLPPAC